MSTKETPRNAEPYVNALLRHGLQPYNPRNKAFLEQEEVQGLLGALQAIIDPQLQHLPVLAKDLTQFIVDCRAQFDSLASTHAELADYVRRSVASLAKHPGDYVEANLQEIAYFLLSRAPFSDWHADPVRRVRLARLTALLESYTSMPVLGNPNVQRGRMRVSPTAPHSIAKEWVSSFYYLFFGYLARAGMDEASDDEVICPPGYVPLMTIHQAKGLEFPFVFVGHLSKAPSVSETHLLESALSRFPGNPLRTFKRPPEVLRAELDLIRQFYVAYSRAQFALVMLGTKSQVKNEKGTSTPCGPTARWLPQRVKAL
jgi:DNA helicase-2/ATP-dependent DNA helicase PcrA